MYNIICNYLHLIYGSNDMASINGSAKRYEFLLQIKSLNNSYRYTCGTQSIACGNELLAAVAEPVRAACTASLQSIARGIDTVSL
jgi:hypothetical protein